MSGTPPIEAVVFDAVGTLIEPRPLAVQMYVRIGRKFGSALTADVIRSRFLEAFCREDAHDRERLGLRTSEAREHERWRNIVGSVLDDVYSPTLCFAELYHHFSLPEAWNCLPDALSTLEQLARRGFMLGLASNYDHRLRSVLAGMPQLQMIRTIAVSSEIGWRKPAAEFFADLCRNLGCPPERVLLVGDDLANDYDGARAAGLQAVLFDPGREALHVPRIDRLSELPRLLEQ